MTTPQLAGIIGHALASQDTQGPPRDSADAVSEFTSDPNHE